MLQLGLTKYEGLLDRVEGERIFFLDKLFVLLFVYRAQVAGTSRWESRSTYKTRPFIYMIKFF